MKLSIVIVNYNVKYFLEQCLHSVQKACKGLETEIFVVDNNSVDGSVKMVRENFPDVHLIENKDNKGFSKANNQAIRKAKGNISCCSTPIPSWRMIPWESASGSWTIIPDAGGLGVKMIDGKGKFLPESKRGSPTPSVAFFKIFGFHPLFPEVKDLRQISSWLPRQG